MLANIFAHYVLDEWFEEVVKQHCDLVLVFRTLNHAIDNKFCSNNTGML